MTPLILDGSELIATLPTKAANIFQSTNSKLQIYNSPIAIDPISVYLTWRELPT